MGYEPGLAVVQTETDADTNRVPSASRSARIVALRTHTVQSPPTSVGTRRSSRAAADADPEIDVARTEQPVEERHEIIRRPGDLKCAHGQGSHGRDRACMRGATMMRVLGDGVTNRASLPRL